MNPFLVTGATGHVGREVAVALLQSGAEVIAACRDPADVAGLVAAGAAAVRFDFNDRSRWSEALEGIRGLFLMRPPAIADVANNLLPFIDAAQAAGVEHVVFLSVAGAGSNRWVPHRKVEDHLRARGDGFTNLRPGFFAQNLQSSYQEDIASDDRIYVPAGSGLVNWIDVRDVAAVAACILLSPKAHRGQSYTLTGPGPVAWAQVEAALSRALSRPIRYQPASVWGYARHLHRRGLPPGAIAVQTILHFLLRFGQGAGMDPALEQLLGRPGRGIEAYIAEFAHLWAKKATASAGCASAPAQIAADPA